MAESFEDKLVGQVRNYLIAFSFVILNQQNANLFYWRHVTIYQSASVYIL